MRITKKLATVGVGTGLFAASLVALPFGGTASAKTLTPQLPNDFGTNEAMDVQTELNCSTHTLTAKVTNKTDGQITPNVTFNQMPSVLPPMPIEPGKTGYTTYSYSGNLMPVETEVSLGTSENTITLNQTLQCNEDVSFLVTQASESAVGGMLSNNSTLSAQVVLTRAVGGDVRVENLAPGESRFVAMPFTGMPDQTFAFVIIAVNGSESTYSVDLTRPPLLPPLPPAPEPKDEI